MIRSGSQGPRAGSILTCLVLVFLGVVHAGCGTCEPPRGDAGGGGSGATGDRDSAGTPDAASRTPAGDDAGPARDASSGAEAGAASSKAPGDAGPEPIAQDAGRAGPLETGAAPPAGERDAGARKGTIPARQADAGAPATGRDSGLAAGDAAPAQGMADGGTAKLTGEVAELTSLVQNAYRDARGFEADFEQTYRNRLLDRQQKSQGHVWLRPPTRMRWEYATPTKNLIVADGRTLFVFEPEPNQVVRMPVASSELPAVMAFLTGGRDLNLDYHVALVAPDVSVALRARGQGGLELVPRSPSSVVERVVLVVARDTGQVQKTVLVEPEGNTNTFVWSKVRTADSLPDSRFSFTPPPDARVIERGR